jgi:hypothetical protein
MVSSTITPGIDKVQVFAGVRKLTDGAVAGAQFLYEFSTTINSNNGSFNSAPSYNGTTGLQGPFWNATSKGTTAVAATSPATFPAPLTAVQSHLADIAGDNLTLRINGTQVVQNTNEQGTGNYLAYPLYIGARAGTSFSFNGELFGLITRFGTTLTPQQITSTEQWLAPKSTFFRPVITGVPTVGVS